MASPVRRPESNPSGGLDEMRSSRLLGAILTSTFGASADVLSDHLESGRLQRALDELAALAGRAAPRIPAASLPDLQAARVLLFSANPGGLPAPPYAGLAIDGELLGPATSRLQALLSAHGYTPAPGWTDLPDHLAVIGAVLADETCPAELATRLQAEFLRPWLERYGDTLAAADRSGVYAAVTRLLADLDLVEVERATRA